MGCGRSGGRINWDGVKDGDIFIGKIVLTVDKFLVKGETLVQSDICVSIMIVLGQQWLF